MRPLAVPILSLSYPRNRLGDLGARGGPPLCGQVTVLHIFQKSQTVV